MRKILRTFITILIMILGIFVILKYVPMGGFKEAKKEVKNPNNILVLVNRNFVLADSYKPKDLVIPKVGFAENITSEEKYMRKEASKALEELFSKAKQENSQLYLVSGFRSYNTQKQLYETRAKQNGKAQADKYVATAGNSEHQTGLAADITNKQGSKGSLTTDFGQTKEGKWLKNNAHKYGFIVRYPLGKEKITGYSYEPWHLRYVGNKTSKNIYEKGIVLEEFVQNEKKTAEN